MIINVFSLNCIEKISAICIINVKQNCYNSKLLESPAESLNQDPDSITYTIKLFIAANLFNQI